MCYCYNNKKIWYGLQLRQKGGGEHEWMGTHKPAIWFKEDNIIHTEMLFSIDCCVNQTYLDQKRKASTFMSYLPHFTQKQSIDR